MFKFKIRQNSVTVVVPGGICEIFSALSGRKCHVSRSSCAKCCNVSRYSESTRTNIRFVNIPRYRRDCFSLIGVEAAGENRNRIGNRGRARGARFVYDCYFLNLNRPVSNTISKRHPSFPVHAVGDVRGFCREIGKTFLCDVEGRSHGVERKSLLRVGGTA